MGSNIVNDLSKLHSILKKNVSLEFQELLSGTLRLARAGSNPTTQAVQEKINHMVGGLLTVYLFGLFETYFKRDEWFNPNYTKPAENKKLKAFLHIRHSAAHGFDGSRAKRYRTQFDQVQRSNEKIGGVLSFTSTRLQLHQTIGLELIEFMCDLVQNNISRRLNH